MSRVSMPRRQGVAIFVATGLVIVGYQWLRRRRWRQRIAALPKVELHVHFDGAWDVAELFREAQLDPSSLPEPTRSTVQRCRSLADFKQHVVCKGSRSLAKMLQCFEVFLPIVQGKLGLLEELAYRFGLAQAAQNVIYTEVRYAPLLLLKDGAYEAEDEAPERPDGAPVVEAVTRGLRRACRETGIVIKQILCCLAFRPDWAMATVELAQKYRGNNPCAVVGVDVAAGEEFFDLHAGAESFYAHREAMHRARELGLGITLHAGEAGLGEHVEQAVRDYGATRIGHGYRIAKDAATVRRMAEHNIHFELCPTSSFEAGGWNGEAADRKLWRGHPLVDFVRGGVSFGINSDDPMVFGTSLTEEIRIVDREMGQPWAVIRQAMLSAMDAAFCSDAVKAELRAKIRERSAD